MNRKLMFITTLFLVILCGCSHIKFNPDEIDKIEVKVDHISKMPTGTAYTLRLINGSPYLIKQNNVYLSYGIKRQNGSSSNTCKVEATGNKLNIKPGEEILLNVFMNIENYQDNKLIDPERPNFEIYGYLFEVTELNHFGMSGGLDIRNIKVE